MDKKEILFLFESMKNDMKDGLVYPNEWESLAKIASKVDKKLSQQITHMLDTFMEKRKEENSK